MTTPSPYPPAPDPAMASAHLRELSACSRERLAKIRMVFTVTTGRSGTDFLSTVCGLLPEVTSKHEAKPDFADVMRRVQLGVEPDLARRWWVQEKLRRIARCRRPIHVEASHVFCKGFAKPLIDLGYIPKLILLSRPHRDVAKSMFRLGTIPARTLRGDRWYLRPDDPGVLPIRGWQAMHDYQLCYWYTLEIARRQDLYESMIAGHGGSSMRITLAELTTPDGFDRLSRFITGHPATGRVRRRFRRLAGRPHNTKDRRKDTQRMQLPGNLDALEAQVQAAIAEPASKPGGAHAPR